MTQVLRLTVAALALWGGTAGARMGMMGPGRTGPPAFLEELFVPSLIMEHQGEIGLTAAQRKTINEAMSETQERVLTLRWQFEEKSQALRKLVAAERVDEAAALAAAGEVLAIEEQMKKAHLGLLVRIKNALTPAQQATLRKLRPPDRGERREPRAPGGE
jgi:Spy/CpxP family protein refolding chaperone